MRFQALPGFRDFFPGELATRRWVEAAWREASLCAGFEEIDGPVLESLELFTAKSGPEIVDQLYAFEDKGGRPVALRPEMTPTLARMVAAHAGGLPKPIKWYCIPEFYRYEKPQRGRTRSFYQWNVDVIGSEEAAADAESMAVAIDALRRLGLGPEDVVLRLNDRRFVHRLLVELDVTPQEQPEILGCIDKLERDAAARERLEARLGAARSRRILDCCEKMPLDAAPELGSVIAACHELGIGEYVQPDFHVVRGLAYYTGPVWEIFDRGRELRAVAGGGRYDRLIAAMGGPELPALGFGMGDVVLGELLCEKGLVPARPPRVDVYVVPVGGDMCAAARRVLALLRRAGVRADAPYGAVRVGKALKAADAAGARRAVLVGPDEWREGSVRVKDLVSGEESKVRVEDLA